MIKQPKYFLFLVALLCYKTALIICANLIYYPTLLSPTQAAQPPQLWVKSNPRPRLTMYFQKRAVVNQLNTKTYSSNISSVPWEEAARIYREAADTAESDTVLAMQAAYEKQYTQRLRDAVRLAGIDET